LSDLPDYVGLNREGWTRENAQYTDAAAARQWAAEEISWGVFSVPERELDVLGNVGGLDVVELGCGTAYFSAWLARRGARPVGVDVTPAQLHTARAMQERFGLEFPLIEANAEDVPLPDEAFDLALSEFGASLWCDPARWVPEAVRLLRPGGRLVFLTTSVLHILCSPDDGPVDERLRRDQFGMYRVEWPNEDGVEFHLAHGDWIALIRENGLLVERLVELEAPPEARDPSVLRLRARGVGAPVAGRGDLGRAEDVTPPILLASTSPQRRVILEQLGLPFDVIAPRYEERDDTGLSPTELVQAHAAGKARSVAGEAGERPVLGVDTAVVVDGRVLGKPADEAEAAEMLEALSGRTHVVVSGLCLLAPGWEAVDHDGTRVSFRELTPRDIAAYVRSGEWHGRAGGYAIQGFGATLVDRIEGDYLNVVGLPAALLVRLLAERFPGAYGIG
jgi:MAF protein